MMSLALSVPEQRGFPLDPAIIERLFPPQTDFVGLATTCLSGGSGNQETFQEHACSGFAQQFKWGWARLDSDSRRTP